MTSISSSDRLAARMIGRDNNFNLFRMIAAMMVAVMHFIEVGTGVLYEQFNILGYLALDFFFVCSGFLISASILRRQNLLHFTIARIFRIFPALIAVSLIIAVILGPMVTTVSLQEYFSSSSVASYFFVTSLTTTPHMTLPGVFENALMLGEPNVPIWTLKYELALYFVTAIAFAIGVLRSKKILVVASLLVLAGYVATLLLPYEFFNSVTFKHTRHFGIAFMMGTLAYVFADKIILHWVPVIAGALFAYGVRNSGIGELAMLAWAAYFTFWFAYLKLPILLKYNKLGDYSYGTYIFHWPIICTIATLMPGRTLPEYFLLGFAAVFVAAILSWHFIESPMLRLSKQLSQPKSSVQFPALKKSNSGQRTSDRFVKESS